MTACRVAEIRLDRVAFCHDVRRMTHADIIARLGGHRPVAAALGIGSENTVLYWTRPGRRIPPSYWTGIAAMAAEKGVAVSIETLATLPHNPVAVAA